MKSLDEIKTHCQNSLGYLRVCDTLGDHAEAHSMTHFNYCPYNRRGVVRAPKPLMKVRSTFTTDTERVCR